MTFYSFSQDLELIDSDLPGSLDVFLLDILGAISEAVLVFIGSSYLAAVIPLCIVVLYCIQFYYLRTSRQLRLLDIEAKAPLFSHFLETLDGVTCIRAFGWSQNHIEMNYRVLNDSQKPYYLLLSIQRWLTLVLDLFVAALAIALVSAAVNIHNPYLGVALFNVVAFSSSLQSLIAEWTELETAIGAVSRIRGYEREVPSEIDDKTSDDSDMDLPEDWPAHGAISFDNVSAAYEKEAKSVLDGVSFSIQAGEKVAVCGRTGRYGSTCLTARRKILTQHDSGKSSLLATLLRMLELQSGTITIDGIDITSVPCDTVRKRLNTTPQEPFHIPGSVRDNLDPSASSSEARLISILRKVQLEEWLVENGGLDGDFTEESLSHGQRQVFSLARSMVRDKKVVVMDEVTSR